MMETIDRIRPIIVRAYGPSVMAQSLADHLALRIDAGETGRDGSREDLVMRTCWDWMTGGGTATNVAREIEQALNEGGATYEVERLMVGELVQQEVAAVRMSRARFLEIVDEALGNYPVQRDELRRVAEGMTRFPLGSWIHQERGCGCIAGEYLVAVSEESRAVLASLTDDDLETMLLELPQGEALVAFGCGVDAALEREVNWDRGIHEDGVQVIVVDDDKVVA